MDTFHTVILPELNFRKIYSLLETFILIFTKNFLLFSVYELTEEDIVTVILCQAKSKEHTYQWFIAFVSYLGEYNQILYMNQDDTYNS